MKPRLTVGILTALLSALLAGAAFGEGATIKGKISFKGTPPKTSGKKIKMDGTPECAAMHSKPVYHEWIVVDNNGGLRDVFVYIKSDLPDKEWPVPEENVLLDQKGCMYVPHVFGVMAGQGILIRNSDNTSHNVHALPKLNAPFNDVQPRKDMKLVRTFKTPEMAVKIKCDVHSWMVSWAHVMDHPFFDTSAADGTYEIKDLPPGKHIIALWTGKKLEDGIEKEIEVTEGQALTLDFEVGR